ncbi:MULTISPECIES: S1C family serine protease [unclassified Brevibacterium]|uniref:S1C family serine protease n=1 Tax=unclassified Brevibacterium TaxID=2614124 RepID=UPI00362CFD24
MSSNDGNTPRNRGRHGDDDYRTFPTDGSRASSDVPRTFPTSDQGASPRRDGATASDPSQPGSGQGQPDPSTRSFPAAPGQGQPGTGRGEDTTRVQPTYAQTPGDNSRGVTGAPQGNAGGGHLSGPGQHAGSGQQSGQQSGSGQSGYGSSGYGSSNQPSTSSPFSPAGQQSTGGASTSGQSGADRYGQNPTSGSGQYGAGSGQSGQYGAGSGQSGQYGAGSGQSGQYGAGSGQSGQAGQQGTTGSTATFGTAAGAGAAAGAAAGSGSATTGPAGSQQASPYGGYGSNAYGSGGYGSAAYGSNPSGPGGPGGPGDQGPYGGGAPPRRQKRGPGWGATIAIALIAALIGGGAAFGGSYAVNALQDDAPRKVAEQTIETPDWTQVAKQASEAVVSIQAGVGGRPVALGSGSLYDDQGHVITNNHVVAPSDTAGGELTVTMKSGAAMKASIVGRDPSTDIAIIKLDQVPQNVTPLPVGDSKALQVGDPVMALGNPLGLADSVTTGIVSALDRPVTTENIGDDASAQQRELTITNAIQTDAAINPGNSGGPLVDGNGNFIGVNSAAASLGSGEEGQQSGSIGIGFAIPASQAVSIADQLIATGQALHPFLGVTLTDGQINSGGVTRASAKVQTVEAGSPAAAAGFQDGDDVIAVGGTKVNSAVSLQALVRAQPVNTPVDFTIVRGGQEQNLQVSLELK